MRLSDASRSGADVMDAGAAAAMAVEVDKAGKDHAIIDATRLFDAADAPVFDDHPPRAKPFWRKHSAFDGCHRKSVP
jgi:hypothetical protein